MKKSGWIWIAVGIGALAFIATEGGNVVSNIVSSAYSAVINAFALRFSKRKGGHLAPGLM
jgi:membrane associated rhomboid family serine protease